jgi:hypothetical protein
MWQCVYISYKLNVVVGYASSILTIWTIEINKCSLKTFMPKQQWLSQVDKYHYYMLFILHFNVILMTNILYISCLLITLLLQEFPT